MFRSFAYPVLTGMITLLFVSSVFAQGDKKIFGVLELGVPVAFKECNLILEEFQYLGDQQGGLLGKLTSKKRYRYAYDKNPPTDAPCYRRINLDKVVFNKKSEIIPLPLPRPSAWVSFVFPDDAHPALAAKNEVIGFFLDDGRLDGAMFKFDKNDSDTVLASLKKKYGNKPKITPMKWQNSTGAVVDYYIAEWHFPTFKVEMESAGVKFWVDLLTDYNAITASAFREINSPFSSPHGRVVVSQKSEEDIKGITEDKKKIPL